MHWSGKDSKHALQINLKLTFPAEIQTAAPSPVFLWENRRSAATLPGVVDGLGSLSCDYGKIFSKAQRSSAHLPKWLTWSEASQESGSIRVLAGWSGTRPRGSGVAGKRSEHLILFMMWKRVLQVPELDFFRCLWSLKEYILWCSALV